MGQHHICHSWPIQSAPAPSILLDCLVWEGNHKPHDDAFKSGPGCLIVIRTHTIYIIIGTLDEPRFFQTFD